MLEQLVRTVNVYAGDEYSVVYIAYAVIIMYLHLADSQIILLGLSGWSHIAVDLRHVYFISLCSCWVCLIRLQQFLSLCISSAALAMWILEPHMVNDMWSTSNGVCLVLLWLCGPIIIPCLTVIFCIWRITKYVPNKENSPRNPASKTSLVPSSYVEHGFEQDVNAGNSSPTQNSVGRPTIYIYSQYKDAVRREIILKELRDDFELQEVHSHEHPTDQVVLVYGVMLGRAEGAIHKCITYSPGKPDMKVLVMFTDYPMLSSSTDDDSDHFKHAGVFYIASLKYSSFYKKVLSSKKTLNGLRDILHQLTRSKQTGIL